MAVLCHPNTAPPDGWWFVVPESGVHIDGWTLTELTERVMAHRDWTKKVVQSFDETKLEIERQICSGMPEGVCRAEPGENYKPYKDMARGFTTELVMGASRTALEFLKNGGELVSKSESERRAAICRGCRFNRQSPSWICSSLCAALDALIPKGRRENGLLICGICSCTAAAKVLLPLEVMQPDAEARELTFPPHCWMAKPDDGAPLES